MADHDARLLAFDDAVGFYLDGDTDHVTATMIAERVRLVAPDLWPSFASTREYARVYLRGAEERGELVSERRASRWYRLPEVDRG